MVFSRGTRGRQSALLTNLLSATVGCVAMASAHAQTAASAPPAVVADAAGASGASGASETSAVLPAVKVSGQSSPYQTKYLESDQFTAPLLDIAQSVAIVPKRVLDEQQAQSLQDILKNVPGITFTSGEGNLGWGDMFTIRGFSGEQSITIDGLRDAGLASRSDTFDVERVEVFKGTGTIESGVAAPGGSVNLVTKEAHLGDAYHLSTTLGSARYRRVTADLDKQIGEHSALRLNLMRHTQDVDERANVHDDRWGVAGSLAIGLGTPTRVTLDYFHQQDNNVPDTGVPIERGTGGKTFPGVARNAWYGDPDLYKDHSTTNRATVKIEHDFNDNTRISNITRWEQTDRTTVLAPARFNSTSGTSYGYTGTGSLVTSGSGILSYSGATADANLSPLAVLRGNNYGTSKRYDILANETNLNTSFDTAGLHHDLVIGAEFYHERYGDLPRSVLAPSTNPVMDLTNAYGTSMGGVETMEGTTGDYAAVNDAGVYLRDTVTITPKWIVEGAARYDRFWVKQVSGAANAHSVLHSSDGAFSGRIGVTYKPLPFGSIYASYARAAQPSAVGATTNNTIYGATSAATANLKPAVAQTYELGTKWDLLNQRLSLTGALFRTELSDSWDYGDTTSSVVRELPPKRVDGIEVGVSGNITEKWSAFAGVAAMRGRITKGVNEGQRPANVPNATFNLWTTYAVTPKFSVSYGLQYVGTRRYTDNEYVGGQNNNSSTVSGANGTHPAYVYDAEKAPAFWLHSLAAHYTVNKNLSLGLNVQNLFNKFYYSAVGASLDGFQLYGVPGAGRTVLLSADVRF